MSEFNKELKTYAENGLRTAADWLSIGREVDAGCKPRSNATSAGQPVDLFTRDQTQPHAREKRQQ